MLQPSQLLITVMVLRDVMPYFFSVYQTSLHHVLEEHSHNFHLFQPQLSHIHLPQSTYTDVL
jgi:hypothetical protein